MLRREPTKAVAGSSLLSLPYPYIVPGGRFGAIYYWDSYFTMLGLRESDQIEMIENVLKNFASLINRYGFIPNGNRSYYLRPLPAAVLLANGGPISGGNG